MTVTPGKNIAILCNPLAGAGRSVALAAEISRALAQKAVTHRLFSGDWPDLGNLYTDIFIVGGDGTLNYFFNRYPGIQTALAVFNGGTGNDIHWLLYGGMTLEQQLETVLTEDPKPLDLGICNGRYFINGVGIGFEGEVARALTGKKKRPGKTSFLATILKKIFTYHSRSYNIITEEIRVSGKKLLVDISNGRRAGGGFYIAPEASASDGQFDIVIAGPLTALQRFRYLPVIEKGKHLGLPFIQHFRASGIRVESDEPVQYHLDGEYAEAMKLEIEIIPAAVNFRF